MGLFKDVYPKSPGSGARERERRRDQAREKDVDRTRASAWCHGLSYISSGSQMQEPESHTKEGTMGMCCLSF